MNLGPINLRNSKQIIIPETCQDPEQRTSLDDALENPYIREEVARKYVERMKDIMTVDVTKDMVEHLKQGLGISRKELTKGISRPIGKENIPINFRVVERKTCSIYEQLKGFGDYKAPPFGSNDSQVWGFECKNSYCADVKSTLDIVCRQQYEYMFTHGIINRPDGSHGKQGVLKFEIILIYRNKKNPLNVQIIYLDELTRTENMEGDVCNLEFTYYLKSRKADHDDIKDPSCYYNKDFYNRPRLRITSLGHKLERYIIDSKTKQAPSLRMIIDYILTGKDFSLNQKKLQELA